jgi:hypothetical protein
MEGGEPNVQEMEKQARALLHTAAASRGTVGTARKLLEAAAAVPGTNVAQRRAVLLSWLAWLNHGPGAYPAWFHKMHVSWCSFAVPFAARDLVLIGDAVRMWVHRVCSCNFGFRRRPFADVVSAACNYPCVIRTMVDVLKDTVAALKGSWTVRVLLSTLPQHMVTAWVGDGLLAFFENEASRLPPADLAAHHGLECLSACMSSTVCMVLFNSLCVHGCSSVEKERKLLWCLLRRLEAQAVPITTTLALFLMRMGMDRMYFRCEIVQTMSPQWVTACLHKVAQFGHARLDCDTRSTLRHLKRRGPPVRLDVKWVPGRRDLGEFLTWLVMHGPDPWHEGLARLVQYGLGDVCAEALLVLGLKRPSNRAVLDACLVVGLLFADCMPHPGVLWRALTVAEGRYYVDATRGQYQRLLRRPIWVEDTTVLDKFFPAKGQRERASDVFYCSTVKQQRWVRPGKKAWLFTVQIVQAGQPGAADSAVAAPRRNPATRQRKRPRVR